MSLSERVSEIQSCSMIDSEAEQCHEHTLSCHHATAPTAQFSEKVPLSCAAFTSCRETETMTQTPPQVLGAPD
eukprot:6368682-Amphidinium_carterae.3